MGWSGSCSGSWWILQWVAWWVLVGLRMGCGVGCWFAWIVMLIYDSLNIGYCGLMTMARWRELWCILLWTGVDCEGWFMNLLCCELDGFWLWWYAMLCVGFWFGCIDCKININKKHHRKLCVKQVPNMLKNFYCFFFLFLNARKPFLRTKLKPVLQIQNQKKVQNMSCIFLC